MRRRRKGPQRAGLVVMSLGVVDFLGDVWLWLGQVQQAEQLWKDKGVWVERLGWLIDQWWTAPLLIGVGAVMYVGMGFFHDLFFGKKDDDDDQRPAAPITNTASG